MKKPHKYGAKAVVIDGHHFPSTKEGNRYCELKLLQRAGEIANLRLQPKFPMTVNGMLVTTYIADFVYEEKGELVIEDSKGVETDVFKIKSKLFHALYPYELRIT